MAKARSSKSVGFWGDAVNYVKEKADDVKEAFTPDEGTVMDKLQNQRKYTDEAIDASTTTPAPKPERTTPQTKNEQLAKDEKKSKKLTKKQVEDIRNRLAAGEKVKTKEYD